MIIQVLIPSIGESITEAEIAHWLVDDGQFVEKGADIVEIDSEKATITLSAEASGIIKIISKDGETVNIGAVIAQIEGQSLSADYEHQKKSTPEMTSQPEVLKPVENIITTEPVDLQNFKMTPLARQILRQEEVAPTDIPQKSGSEKISKQDVLSYINNQKLRKTSTVKMSMLRRKLAERLVAVKNQTAMLTTFNEVDMSNIIELRKKYKDAFVKKHNIKLGFMSFFVKAVTIALGEYPAVNASIDGENLLFHDFVDISVAVSTDKGLMVPVVRNTEKLSLAAIEKEIFSLSEKARNNKIAIEEMTGGTFTITNGGIFGSMLSTPILNPPQSAILGMHNIQDRAVVINGEIKIRPIMYIALSYDHRIIDGKESVSFVVRVKELLENPLKMVLTGNASEENLLDL